MSKSGYVIAFASGMIVGAFAAYTCLKNKFEASEKEEIVFRNEPSEKQDINEYTTKIRENGYTNYTDCSRTADEPKAREKSEEEVTKNTPEVVSPDEFENSEEENEYEKISLTYYEDQVLADEDDNPIEDVENLVGFESLTRFGEFEEDAVYVRNDRLKCYFEILRDKRLYSDVVLTKPHSPEE